MKLFKVISALAALLVVAATQALANPQGDESGSLGPIHRNREVYVWVTGSRIPQKITISPVGTPNFSSMSVWDRRQIDQTGRQTTEGVLAQDPFVRVILNK